MDTSLFMPSHDTGLYVSTRNMLMLHDVQGNDVSALIIVQSITFSTPAADSYQ